MADFPMVNGKAYDYSAIETSVPLAGILREIIAIKYSHNVEPGELRAGVPWVVATGRGQYSAEGGFTISKQAHVWLVQKLSELSKGQGYMNYEFPIQVVYKATGMETVKDSLWDCRLIGDDASNETGSDPSIIECKLFVKAVYINGNKPFGDMPWSA